MQVVGDLARAGGDPCARTLGGTSALTAAAEEGRLSVVKTLLKLGLGISRRTWADALCAAARCGHLEVLQKLILVAGDGGLPGPKFIQRTGTTPLHCASANGHLGAVRLLLEAGADETLLNGAGFYAREVVGTRRLPPRSEDPAQDERIRHMLKHRYLYRAVTWSWPARRLPYYLFFGKTVGAEERLAITVFRRKERNVPPPSMVIRTMCR